MLARAAVTAAGLRAVDPPVALSWRSTPDDLAEAIQCAAADDAIDAIMVIHAPPLATAYAPVAEIDRACSGLRKPIVAVMLGREDGPVQHDSRVPAFSFPEPAAAVLGRMYAYGRWLATEAESLVDAVTDVDVEKAHQILTNAVERGDTELSFADVHALLAAYGVEMPHGLHAHDASADAIVAAAEVIGYPVVIKATRRRVGRSARAGIALDISNDGAAREAIATLRESLGTDADSIVVQRMAAPGVDVRVHCESDPLLGPAITVGLGSLQSIGVDDGASRLAPTSRAAARAMISSSSVGAALQAAGLDDQTLVDTIVRVSHLAVNHPEIAAVEIDPLLVSAHACAATDVHVAVHEPTAVPFPLRRLV